jgi:hypothetical protein
MIECPHCGTQNQPTHRYCGDCGKEIQRPCPSCKALMETNRSFCGNCGAALTGPDGPKWTIQDRRVIARLKGVMVGLSLPILYWLGLIIIGVVFEYDDMPWDATVLVLFFVMPIIVNIIIALRPSGVRAVLANDTFISQASREMVGFPSRVMRSSSPWSWLLVIFGVLTFCATGAVVTMLSAERSLASFVLTYLVIGAFVIPLLIFGLAIMRWALILSIWTFGRLAISAALRGLSGFVIGTLVAGAIAGLELVVADAVLGLYYVDDFVTLVFLVGSMLIGGGLMVAIAWISESFDRYLLWARYQDELQAK